ILLSWIAWVNPFAPKPNPQEDYLDLELVDIKDLPPIPKSSAAPASAVEAKAIPALKPKEATTPKTLLPQKIVSPEEATESAPVVKPSASGSSASNTNAVGGSRGGQGANASGNDGISGRDLSCGPVVVSRGTAVCKSPLRKKVEVRVRISIGKDGKVHSAVVSSSSGNKGADKAAVEAAYKYTFRPAQDKYGNPIASGGTIAVTVQPNR
ncbi:MAG: TonB family protein, partial [Selenomonadales bacterium]|nr:TonB family protein [Selenomonadales bacterium]